MICLGHSFAENALSADCTVAESVDSNATVLNMFTATQACSIQSQVRLKKPFCQSLMMSPFAAPSAKAYNSQ